MRQPKDPALTPAITAALGAAGAGLADRVRADILHSSRPVFGFYLAQTLDSLTTRLADGTSPRPETPAQQLCLHLMIAHVQQRCALPGLDRARAALLPDTSHEILARILGASGNIAATYDFDALGHALAVGGMGAFFAPFDSDEMVA
ncbi:hypothetical protein ACFQ9R_22440 [Nocardia sp. NPDC056541]|uniref:hypothetical protein n=1 Tax=unclassified Nocardia TaxID=2637762 RepID=UPI00365352E9